MRLGYDYQQIECAMLLGGVAVVAFSKDVHRSKNGKPYRRFKLVVGSDLIGGAAFYRNKNTEIVADFPKDEDGKATGTMRYKCDADGMAIAGTGTVWLPGRETAPLTSMPQSDLIASPNPAVAA